MNRRTLGWARVPASARAAAAGAQGADEFPQAFLTGQSRMIEQGPGGPVDLPLRLDPDRADLNVSLCGMAGGAS